ncbi:unknown [Prevotella sp. CAG:1058]|nr:unknown [Prevotella sp. CAG:1058]
MFNTVLGYKALGYNGDNMLKITNTPTVEPNNRKIA